MRVLWNGAKAGPGGAQLFTDEYTPVTAVPDRQPYAETRTRNTQGQRTGTFDKVRQTLPHFDGWFTSQDIADEARITRPQAASALFALCAKGLVQREQRRRGERGGVLRYRRRQ